MPKGLPRVSAGKRARIPSERSWRSVMFEVSSDEVSRVPNLSDVAMGSIRDQMEQIYSETPPGDIPWNNETPPKALVELMEAEQVQPCKAIDLGCGAGNYAIYLAGLGFDVTGVDISPMAIALAEADAKRKSLACRFLVADILAGLPEITETFDFAYDWSLLHHVFSPRQETVRRDRPSVVGSGWEVPVRLL